MDKSHTRIMTSIINRIIELAGWIVLGVSVVLLGVASHIDNYQPPEPVVATQAK
ncbi:division septum protein Blr [Lelliottia amnigena]|nr:division septum protein Blr [Lelliottia amnigena]